MAAAREVLRAVAIEGRAPRPRLGDWWQDVLGRVATFVAGLLNLDSVTVRLLLMAVAWGVIGLTSLALLWFLWGWWRRQKEVPQGAGFERVGWRQRDLGVGAAGWQERLEQAMARGDVSAALEALWFVMATRLRTARAAFVEDGTGEDVGWSEGREWTGRRLLAAAGDLRARLAPAVRGLERITYSEKGATLVEVERLRLAVDEVLPGVPVQSPGRAPLGQQTEAGRK